MSYHLERSSTLFPPVFHLVGRPRIRNAHVVSGCVYASASSADLKINRPQDILECEPFGAFKIDELV